MDLKNIRDCNANYAAFAQFRHNLAELIDPMSLEVLQRISTPLHITYPILRYAEEVPEPTKQPKLRVKLPKPKALRAVGIDFASPMVNKIEFLNPGIYLINFTDSDGLLWFNYMNIVGFIGDVVSGDIAMFLNCSEDEGRKLFDI